MFLLPFFGRNSACELVDSWSQCWLPKTCQLTPLSSQRIFLQVFEAGKGAEDHSGGIRTGLDSRALETVDVSTLHLHDASYINIYIYRSWGGLEKSIINQSLRYICAILCIIIQPASADPGEPRPSWRHWFPLPHPGCRRRPTAEPAGAGTFRLDVRLQWGVANRVRGGWEMVGAWDVGRLGYVGVSIWM